MAENNSENIDVDTPLQHTHIWNGYLLTGSCCRVFEIEALAHRIFFFLIKTLAWDARFFFVVRIWLRI